MRSTDRCTSLCNYPCAKDHRTKREKAEALLAGATTAGERAAAQAALDRMPKHGRTTERSVERCPHGVVRAEAGPRCSICDPYVPPTGPDAQPAGRPFGFRGGSFSFEGVFTSNGADFFESLFRTNDGPLREELRKAQAQEKLRREGFSFPGDAGFEAEFASSASQAQEAFRHASEEIARRRRRQTTAESLAQDFLDGKINREQLRQKLSDLED